MSYYIGDKQIITELEMDLLEVDDSKMNQWLSTWLHKRLRMSAASLPIHRRFIATSSNDIQEHMPETRSRRGREVNYRRCMGGERF